MFALALAAVLTNLTGTVTFAREGYPFYFLRDDDGTNWRVERTADTPDAEVGDRVAVEGSRERSVKHRLAPVAFAVTGPGTAPAPERLSPAEIFAAVLPHGKSNLYGARIETEGLLRDINRRHRTTQLLVGEGDHNLRMEIPWPIANPLPPDWIPGARVRLTGSLAYTTIENPTQDRFGRIEDLELIPLDEHAVEVSESAPFWTAKRLTTLLGALAVFSLVIAAWAVTLRRMVARRTDELAESIRQRETARIEADAARRERLRLAADLHDGFQQYLAGARFRLKAAFNLLPKGAEDSRRQLEKVEEALQHTQSGLRSTLWAMNAESEGPENLIELFAFVARRMPHWAGTVTIRGEGAERKVARKIAGSLLLILQEAVGNAIRHGEAKRVSVLVAFDPCGIRLEIRDDGRGFDPAAAGGSGHFGLAGMERRANELGGSLRIESAPGSGATLFFAIPC